MAYVPIPRNNYSTATPGEDFDASGSRSSSLGLPPPPPPLHISAIPARLSLDHHRDSDGGGSRGIYDLSSISAVVQRLDSHDGRDESDSGRSYELVSRHDADGEGHFGSGPDTRKSSGVLVDRSVGVGGGSTPASPLVVVNHGRDDASQLDGNPDRAWQCVSVGSDTARERQDGAEGAAARGNHHQRWDNESQYIHPALRAPTPNEAQERPYSAGDFFKDFDGVHYSASEAPLPPASAPPAPPHTDHRYAHPQQRASVSQPRPQSRATLNHDTHSESSRDSGFVFYPAPVPAVLNLPPLMAKDTKARNRFSKVQKRASQQVLSDAISTGDPSGNNRRSLTFDALAAPNADASTTPLAENRKSTALDDTRRHSHLPPALRASAFFDSMNSAPTIAPELKEASAVATLDSILDASANAPPAAFTDHPMTGTESSTHLSAPHRNDYRNSVAMTVMLHPGESPRSSMDGGERGDSTPLRTSRSFEAASNNADPALNALPTTLLAELESRKMQLKSRNRTAASAFPTGIRSTLLELDAVAQVQAQSRRAKRTTLAWEDPEDGDGNEDEDVPLGLLYQGQAAQKAQRGGGRDEDVPLGLLMQKAMEDSEPLSRRRDRLRQQNGGPPSSSVPAPKIPPLEETEEEEETLAQRLKRLREKKEKRASAFGDGSLELSFDTSAPPPPLPEEETLGQRRKRLQDEEERRRLAEDAKVVQAEVRKRNSMSTMLSQQHLGAGMMGRSMPMLMQRPGSMGGLGTGGGGGGAGGLIHQAGAGGILRPQMSMGNIAGGGMGGIGMQGMGMQGMGGMSGMGGYGAANGGAMGITGMGGMGMMGGGAAGGAIPMTPQEIAMNNKQREMNEKADEWVKLAADNLTARGVEITRYTYSKWEEAKEWTDARVTNKKYRFSRKSGQRPDPTPAKAPKRLVSRFHQPKIDSRFGTSSQTGGAAWPF
ncbi:hypothetical protein BZA05DRAFT_470136 [Tricharina praecox]|uniref:uncharacterized protein n=1 Tax=Tricharina praecox TaxID=43433 RepID=UPI002220B715|nr:uncharacterized protein BZA05DRAFT_470136 [Tricharina praecox]KAI5858904.1 hypothetical protein BZA05DRAFT_470136 [Tricharina praecox]